jgi:hypothetical protein
MARRDFELEIAKMVRRLIAAHAQCSPDEMAAGLAWYDRAAAAAQSMSGGDLPRAAAVIAHLSPRARWNVNLAWAARILTAADAGEECPAVSTKANRSKAWAAAHGDVAHFGPKTFAFYSNILGDTNAVCVDSWAARAALGTDITNVAPALYRRVETAYQRAARALGMAPRDLQAAIWTHVRGSAV